MVCSVCQQPSHEASRICTQCGAVLVMRAVESRDPYIGQIIGGRFRVLSILGDGGMGRVYLAEQPMGRALRKVAIKTLHSHYAHDPEIMARFERECGLVCQLEHPNTIQFFDFGQTDNGDLYIVMEYVEGIDLAGIIEKQGAISAERVSVILQQICGALDEAHRRGIVHRDLKPSNIMLTTRAGQPDFVKLLDFGIAKKQASLGTHASQLTQSGTVLGTPAYMSPEQFLGQVIDARSDIYSLGVIAYEMLTGTRPFHAKAPWEWATQHLNAQPLPFEAHASSAHLAPAIKTSILRALAKNPAERQASARELWEEMRAEARYGMSIAGPGYTSVGGHEETIHSEDFNRTVYEAPISDVSASMAETDGAIVIPKAPMTKRDKASRRWVLMATGGLFVMAAVVGVFWPPWEWGQSGEESGTAAMEPTGTHGDGPGSVAELTKQMQAALAAQLANVNGRAACAGMAAIPGGSFSMGETGARVTVSPFCLDLTEVTASAYARCVQTGRCDASDVNGQGSCTFGVVGKGDHPINCVDFTQATLYCQAQGKRLPTEEEWEWAARGGSEGRVYPWGDNEPSYQLCWSGIEKRSSTCKVGSFPGGSNFWNVQDLAGNVWEWTSGTHGETGRISRGGSFSRHDPQSLRAANRAWLEPTSRFGYLGFRCASDG